MTFSKWIFVVNCISHHILAKLSHACRFCISSNFFLKKFFGGLKSFLWGHWYHCFGLLVTYPLGFKARVGSLIPTWQRHMCCIFPEIQLWCDTCWPLCGQHGNQIFLFNIPVSSCWWGSKPGSFMPQMLSNLSNHSYCHVVALMSRC